MIGVVVWSNADREKAVIWCEDHAALAYLQGQENLLNASQWPQPGDLVELESEVVGPLRHARRVAMLSEHAHAHLPGLLRGAVPAEPHLRVVASNPVPDIRDQRQAEPGLRTAIAG